MKTVMFLADSAVNHADGTTSAIRAFIDRISLPAKAPHHLSCSMVARCWEAEGKTIIGNASIKLVDPNGKQILDSGTVKMEEVSGGPKNKITIVFNLVNARIEVGGKYMFQLLMSGTVVDELPFTVFLGS